MNARAEAPVMIMAGGTGGHIFPGIAVARALAERGVPVTWLGSNQGLENTLVPKAGIALERIPVAGLRGKSVAVKLAAPFTLLRAVHAAWRAMRRVRPRSAIAFGGFAAGPGGLAARLLGVPLLVHEQNAVPGVTNRVLARLARRVLTGFPDALPGSEAVGNPVRAEIAALPPPDARLAGRTGPVNILVLGGSQGARALNRALPDVITRLADRIPLRVLHQTGRAHHDATWAAYAELHALARTEPFLDDMAAAYGWADLVVCRAGALTLAELCAAGVGAVLVPYPAAVDDHQTANARQLVDAGAARLVPEGAAFTDRLADTLAELLVDRPRLLAMACAARAQARVDAALRIAAACVEEAA